MFREPARDIVTQNRKPRKLRNCSVVDQTLLGVKDKGAKFTLLDRSYDKEQLWLSETSAHYMSAEHGRYLIENGVKSISYHELKATAANLKSNAKKLFSSRLWCQKCLVVGSGSCLRGKNLGSLIDSFPVVIRMNKPPIEGYQESVGSKTDVRFLYPESAPSSKEFYQGEGFVVVVPCKRDDYLWAVTIANPFMELHLKDFWPPNPPKVLPVGPEKVLVINPNVTEALYKKLTGNHNRPGTDHQIFL